MSRKASIRYDRKDNRDKQRAMHEARNLALDLSRSTGIPHEWKWSNGCYFVFTRDEYDDQLVEKLVD